MLFCAWLLGSGGCAPLRSIRDAVPSFHRRDQAASTQQPRRYPSEARRDSDLSIEVIRERNTIMLDNRTVHEYHDTWLWLNQEYGAPISRIGIGRGDAIPLQLFLNRSGESYPIGRFLQPDLDRTLISAELMSGGKLRNLTVRLDDRWRRP